MCMFPLDISEMTTGHVHTIRRRHVVLNVTSKSNIVKLRDVCLLARFKKEM